MNSQPFPTGQLRRFLFKEHLGLIQPDPEHIPINVIEPTIDLFWNGFWFRASKRNTRIYDEVFKCIHTDAESFVSLKKYLEEKPICKSNPEAAMKQVLQLQGHLVDLSFQFLWEQVLAPPGTSKEALIRTSVWT
ncbi:Phospholipase D2 [Pseudolycoriella hygida]|uniref:Phospholipase D2 n=1 Tax=Pseudolycoriella hygida TaxID=35572 RepID=A0A9Q0NDQ1_9DIPT|nr:Phospholipase D2 [Pseudolycoriella hygida]